MADPDQDKIDEYTQSGLDTKACLNSQASLNRFPCSGKEEELTMQDVHRGNISTPRLGDKMYWSNRTPCKIIMREWSAKDLVSFKGVKSWRRRVKVEVEPWDDVQAASSLAVCSDDEDHGMSEWNNTFDNRLALHIPEYSVHESPHIIFSIIEETRSSELSLEKNEQIIAVGRMPLTSFLEMFDENSSSDINVQLKPQGQLKVNVTVMNDISGEETSEKQTSRSGFYGTHKRPSAIRTANLNELMDKLRKGYEHAKRNVLGRRSFESVFESFDQDRSGLVTRPDFVKGLHKLNIRLTMPETGVLMNMLELSESPRGDFQTPKHSLVHYIELEDLILEHMSKDRHPVSPTGEILLVDEDIRLKLRELVKQARSRGISTRKAFAHFDKMQTGNVSKHDFQRGLEQLGFTLSVRELVALLAELDQDQNGYISLAEFYSFVEGQNSQTSPFSPIWSPESKANNEEKVGRQSAFAAASLSSHSYVDGAPLLSSDGRSTKPLASTKEKELLQQLKAENKKLLASLKTCKERIQKAELRCAKAEAENNSIVQRAKRQIIAEEKSLLQCNFVKLINEAIAEHFPKHSSDEDSFADDEAYDLREQAHIAFEGLLEKDIAKLRRQLEEQTARISESERQAAEAKSHLTRFISLFFSKPEIFVPRLAKLSFRSSHIVRCFISKAIHAGFSSSKEYFKTTFRTDIITLKDLQALLEPESLSQTDLSSLAQELGSQGLKWCSTLVILNGQNTECSYDVLELAKGLDHCYEWDINSLFKHNLDCQMGQYKIDFDESNSFVEVASPASTAASEMPAPLAAIVRAAESRFEKTGLGASSWFQNIPLTGYVEWEQLRLDFEDLNDDLEYGHAPTFRSTLELEESFQWICSFWPAVDGTKLKRCWVQEGKIAIHEFCQTIDALSADMRIQQDLEEKQLSIRYPSIDADAFALSRLFLKFSPQEHSSRWPPLVKFGREPYDCVRLLEGDSTVEHSTSRARNVLAFVAGSLGKGDRDAVIMQMNRDIGGSGIWGLCVTCEGAANRPARGAAVYMHTGEARVEGVSPDSKEYQSLLTDFREDLDLLESYSIVPHEVLIQTFEEIDTSDEEILVCMYKRFFSGNLGLLSSLVARSSSLIEDHVQSRQTSHDALSRENLFIWKAREIECRMRLQHQDEILRVLTPDRWTMETKFKDSCCAGYNGDVSYAVMSLFQDFKLIIGASPWQLLLRSVQGDNKSLGPFVKKLNKFREELCQMLHLSPGHLQDFTMCMQRLLNKRQHMHHSHFKGLRFGDRIAAKVNTDRGSVTFYVNGELQTTLTPICSQPWRFAWFTNRAGSATIVQSPFELKIA